MEHNGILPHTWRLARNIIIHKKNKIYNSRQISDKPRLTIGEYSNGSVFENLLFFILELIMLNHHKHVFLH